MHYTGFDLSGIIYLESATKMEQFFTKRRKWISYTLYGILVTPIFLFILFPSDTLVDYIRANVQSKYPGILVNLKKASLSFPVALRLEGIECGIQGSPEQIVFTSNEIVIKPRIWSLLRKNPEYRFVCQAYNGSVTGRINLQENGDETVFSLSTEFDNIHIDEKSPLPISIKGYISGILEGAITFNGNDLFDSKATGEASLTLSDGIIKFPEPILNINAVDFNEVLFKAEFKNRNLNISETSLKGKNFNGEASGIMTVRTPMNKSRINFRGSIEPTSAFIQDSSNTDEALLLLKNVFQNRKTFTISGTIEKPNFRLN